MKTLIDFKNSPNKWFYDPPLNLIMELSQKGLSFNHIVINDIIILNDIRLEQIRRTTLLRLLNNNYFKSKPNFDFIKIVMFGLIPPKMQFLLIDDENDVRIGLKTISRLQCWQLKWADCTQDLMNFLITGDLQVVSPKYKSQDLKNKEVQSGRLIKTDNLTNTHDLIECSISDCYNRSCGRSRMTDGSHIYWIYVCNKHLFGKVKLKPLANKFYQKKLNPEDEII